MNEVFGKTKSSSSVRPGPAKVLIILAASIFVVEFGIMVVFQSFSSLPQFFASSVDASLLVVIVYPMLYLFVFKPLLRESELARALHASELSYRTLTEAAHDMIFVIGRDDRVLYVNTFAAQQFNTTPEQVIGKPRAELFPPDISNQQMRALQSVLTDGAPLSNEDTVNFNGREVWLSNQLVPLRDESGAITAVLGISRDITEHKESEKKVEEYVKKLEEMNQMMVGRELKMIELKKENEMLTKKLAQQ